MRRRGKRRKQSTEQRRHERYALGVAVRVDLLDDVADQSQAACSWRGITVDVSNGGVALRMQGTTPPAQGPVKLWLPLDGLPVRVPVLGVVRRVSDESGDGRYVGVQFAW